MHDQIDEIARRFAHSDVKSRRRRHHASQQPTFGLRARHFASGVLLTVLLLAFFWGAAIVADALYP